MKIGRMIGPAIATHAALVSGIHGVGDDNIISDATVAFLFDAEVAARETADSDLFDKINDDVAAEETARDEAIGAHSDLVTGVHGVGGSVVCSETKAAALVAALAELVDSASPSAAANVEFTGLDGDLFLLIYAIYPSESNDLLLRLNGITDAEYDYRYFHLLTAIATETDQTSIKVASLHADFRNVGCLMLSGKQLGMLNQLTAGHFGPTTSAGGDLLINGVLKAAGGDLSSILFYPSSGTFTGEVKLYKVF